MLPLQGTQVQSLVVRELISCILCSVIKIYTYTHTPISIATYIDVSLVQFSCSVVLDSATPWTAVRLYRYTYIDIKGFNNTVKSDFILEDLKQIKVHTFKYRNLPADALGMWHCSQF